MAASSAAVGTPFLDDAVLTTPLSFWRSLVCDRLRETLGGFLLGSEHSSLHDFVSYIYGLGQSGPSSEDWQELFEACQSVSIVSHEYVASLLVYAACGANIHAMLPSEHGDRDARPRDEANAHTFFVQNILTPALLGSDTAPKLPGILSIVRRMWNEWMYGPDSLTARACEAVTRTIDDWSVEARQTSTTSLLGACLPGYVWSKTRSEDDVGSLCSEEDSYDPAPVWDDDAQRTREIVSGLPSTSREAVTAIAARVAADEVGRILVIHTAIGVTHSPETRADLLRRATSCAATLLCDKIWACVETFAPGLRLSFDNDAPPHAL